MSAPRTHEPQEIPVSLRQLWLGKTVLRGRQKGTGAQQGLEAGTRRSARSDFADYVAWRGCYGAVRRVTSRYSPENSMQGGPEALQILKRRLMPEETGRANFGGGGAS